LLGVTGATGRLGARVARRLATSGVAQRLLVRDPSRSPKLPGAVAVRAPYGDPRAVRAAVDGVSTVLMVSAGETPDRVDQHISFVDSVVAAGVEHLVYISFYGASPTCTFVLGRDHDATEQYIRSSRIGFTFLRDNFYADFLSTLVGNDGIIRGPAADGRVAAVAQDDIADAAAAVLLSPEQHSRITYSLTGPEALSLDEVAATLSTGLGRRVKYERETIEQAYASRAAYGAPRRQVDSWVSTYLAIANGEVAAVTDDVPWLSGHPATSLAELLHQGRSAY
jgi:NAD(P)H dehydrogenase (quinone)